MFQRHRKAPRHLAVLAALAATTGIAWAQTTEPIRIGASSTSLVMLPLLLADVQPAIFEKRGLKLEFRALPGGNNCFAAVFSGATDVCMHGTTSGTDAVANGADFKVLAMTTGPITEIVLSQKTADKLGVKIDDPIDRKLQSLKGLRVSVLGFHEVTLDAMLQPLGLSVGRDLKPIRLADALTMNQSIRNDQIDAAMWSIGSLGPVLSDKSGIRYISIPRGDYPGVKSLPTVSAFVQTSWYNAHKDAAIRVHDAIADSIAQVKADPSGSSKAVKAKWGGEIDQAIWDDAFAQAVLVLSDGAKAKREPWDLLLKMQTDLQKQNYTNAAYDKLLIPEARAD